MFRKSVIFFALIVILIPVVGVQADSMDDAVFCGDLVQSDCQILLDNAAVMNEVHSAYFSMTLALEIAGDTSADHLELNGAGFGSLAVDAAAVIAVVAAGEPAAENGIGTLIELVLTAMTGEVSFSLSGQSAEEPFEMELNLLLKDGVIVFGAEAMEAISGQEMTGMELFGVDVNGAIGDLLSEAGVGAMMEKGETASPGLDELESTASTIVRLPDGNVAGIPVAIFETSIEINSLVSLLMIEDGNDADLSQEADASGITGRQYIGLEDHYTFRMELSIDMSAPGAVIGEDAGDKNLVVDLAIAMSEFNKPVDVEIPEDVMVFPLLMMLQMGS